MSNKEQDTTKDARGASKLTRLLYCSDLESTFTENQLKNWWVVRCLECGWLGRFNHLVTDKRCSDVYCPKCNSTDVDDYIKWEGWKSELTFWWKKISFYAYRKKRREEKELDAMIRAHEQGLHNQSNRTKQ